MQWVRCSDRLPNPEQRVLIYHNDISVATFKKGNILFPYKWNGDGPMHWFGHEVTHWMCLPGNPQVYK